MFQRKCLVAALLTCNAIGFAGAMGHEGDTKDVDQVWSVGAQALYLQPAYTGSFSALPNTIVATDTYVKNYIAPNWGWGFLLEAAYSFHPDHQLLLSWYHYDHTTDFGYKFLSNANHDVYTITPKWDAVNLELGKNVNLGEKSRVSLLGGLQYAHIGSSFFDSGTTLTGIPGSESINAWYNGVGPRIGANLFYDVMHDLSVYAKGATTMLVGNGSFIQADAFDTSTNSSGTKSLIIPEVELKLGAVYSHAIAQGNVSLNAGYMFVNYFNVLLSNEVGSEANFALNGPYIGAQWTGNI